ncbi:MAG: hypothetical protein AAGI03_03505 [Pseudomonadota bacterium]
MMHPSTKKLLDRLADMTRQRRIAWQETSSGTGVAYAAEGYTVHFIKEPQTLQLSDARGNILEEVTSADLAATQNDDGDPYTTVFDDTFREASRQARGTEKAIDTVLAGLDLDGDGIPDVPAPSQISQQPLEPTDDASSYEDVADETGSVGTTYAATSIASGAATNSGSSSNTMGSGTSSWGGSSFGSAREQEIPQTNDVTDDSANNVGEAVANMANEVNGSGEATTTETGSTSGILGGGTYGNSGFGSTTTQATPDPDPVPSDKASSIQSAYAPDTTRPATRSWDNGASAPVASATTPAPQDSTGGWQSTPETDPALQIPGSQSTAAPTSSATPEPAEVPSTQQDRYGTTTPSSAGVPSNSSGWNTPRSSSDETPRQETPYTGSAGQAARDEPTQTTEYGSNRSSGIQSDTSRTATDTWNSQTSPQSADNRATSSYPSETARTPETSTFGRATETASASTFGSSETSTPAVPTRPDTTVQAPQTTFGAARTAADSVVSSADSAVDAAGTGISGAAASLAGSASSAGQAVSDAASQAASTATGSARSILGGAASQAAGAAGALAGAGSAISGTIGQAAEGVADKLSPSNSTRSDLLRETDEDDQPKNKPLTRFNPWS